ncbi:S41 family peptidase [Sharpea porci]|uniref:S41 family peptidase n=1 Tax=Sharpea porci TaxID=2652286 RepID=UPI002A914184|nr:S41 family peptidase [Sharpea porci]MDY5278956.1 S41 family peptidase [Sharpea porci]
MDKQKKKRITFKAYVVTICIVLVIGLVGGYGLSGLINKVAPQSNTSRVNEVYKILKNAFYDTTHNKTSLDTRILKGMVDGLGDIHSQYLTKDESKAFTTSVNGDYEGIGITYLKVHSGIMVSRVYENTPAYSAGIKAGDIIVSADGVDLAKQSYDKIPDLILGKSGTSVMLKMKKNDQYVSKKVTRKAVETDFYAYIANKNGKNYGYIHLNTIGSNTDKKVENILNAFKEKHVTELIVDLRDNGGGYVGTAKDILSLFNKKGETLYYLRDKSSTKPQKDNTNTDFDYQHGYVLVNENTASSAELIASTLNEVDGFTTVGSKTYGKSIIQVEDELSNGATLKYTDSEWLTSKKKVINKKGINPDIKIESYNRDFNTKYFSDIYKVDQVDEHIKMMEIMLETLHYQPGRKDGYFSVEASESLKRYENEHHLTVNGEYDYNDFENLLSDYMNYITDTANDLVLNDVLGRL